MNRTNPYAAEATGRSTGETIITAWVVSVLLMPMNAPDTIVATITVFGDPVPKPITASTIASITRLAYNVGAVPKRRCSRGATATLNSATRMPQPVNTRPSWIGPSFIGIGRVAEKREEAPVVAQRGEAHDEQTSVAQRLERRGQGRLLGRLRRRWHEDRGRDEGDRHESAHPEERAAPTDVAEEAAQERPDRDAETERGFVQDDRALEAAARRRDDDRERGRDEQRVAQAPAGAETDDAADASGRAGQCGERHDEHEASHQRALGADPARHPVRREHRHRRDHEIAREQQGDLRGRRVQLFGQGGQDRVDQTNAHERDDARESHGPDGAWLTEETRLRLAVVHCLAVNSWRPDFLGGLDGLLAEGGQ